MNERRKCYTSEKQTSGGRISRLLRQLVPLTMMIMLLGTMVFGQVTSGTITGTVKDPSGAVVSGAKVTIKADSIGINRTVSATPTGDFVFANLPPATYSLIVDATGFKKLETTGLILNVADRLNTGVVTLQVGAADTSVTVAADSGQVQLQAASGERSDLIDTKQLNDVAMNGRNLLDYMKLIPGVASSFDGHQSATGGLTSLNINGTRSRQHDMTIDGSSNVDTGDNGGTHVTINTDAIAEIKVLNSNYQAEFGKAAGGQIAVVTKNGTSDFHGDARFFHRHEGLNANDYYDNKNGNSIALYRYNNFGYQIGGPVLIPGTDFNKHKDKLFFFWSEEFFRQLIPNGRATTYLPTTAERNGDFTKSVDQNGKPVTVTGDGVVPGSNVITKSALSASHQAVFGYMQALLNLMPQEGSKGWVPGFGTNGLNYNYAFNQSYNHPRREDIARLDYQINVSNRLFGRYVGNTDTQDSPLTACGDSSYPVNSGGCKQDHPGYNFSLNLVSTITPTIVNEFSVGPSYSRSRTSATGSSLTRGSNGLDGLSLLFPVASSGNIPDLQWWDDKSSNWNWDYLGSEPWYQSNLTINFNDNLTWIKKNHTYKAGVFFQHSRKLQAAWGNYNGEFQFNNDINGDPYANILEGEYGNFKQSSSRPDGDFRYKQLEFYVQDTWKITNRLTLDYGVRFSWIPPQIDAKDQFAIFNPASYNAANAVTINTDGSINTAAGGNPINGMQFASDGSISKGGWSSKGPLPEPRVGFAYDVFGNQKTIVRGGYGMAHDRIQGNLAFDPVFYNPRLVTTPTVYSGNVADLAAASAASQPLTNIIGGDKSGNIPLVSSFSLGVQRDLGKGTTLDVAYVGTLSRHLVTARDINALPYGTKFTAAAQNPANYAGGVVPKVEPGLPAAYAAAGYNFTGKLAYADDVLVPYKGYDQVEYLKFDGTSNYNSLQVSLQHRFSKGLTFGAVYTWSKSLTTANDDEDFQDPFNPRALDYRTASWDRTHMFAANYVYDIPGLSKQFGGPKWLSLITDNFQLSGVTQVQTGTPIDTNIGGSNYSWLTGGNNNTKIPALYWSTTKNGTLIAPQLGAPQRGTRDILRTGGLQNWDMSLLKNFKFTEQRSFQLRLEAFNAFNHANFSGKDTNVNLGQDATGNPTLTPANATTFLKYTGTYSGAGGPRVVQLGAKFYF